MSGLSLTAPFVDCATFRLDGVWLLKYLLPRQIFWTVPPPLLQLPSSLLWFSGFAVCILRGALKAASPAETRSSCGSWECAGFHAQRYFEDREQEQGCSGKGSAHSPAVANTLRLHLQVQKRASCVFSTAGLRAGAKQPERRARFSTSPPGINATRCRPLTRHNLDVFQRWIARCRRCQSAHAGEDGVKSAAGANDTQPAAVSCAWRSRW